MYIKVDNKSLMIKAVSPIRPKKEEGTTIIFAPNIKAQKPEYIVVWKEGDKICVREMSKREKELVDKKIFELKRKKMLNILERTTKRYIESYYPEVKQRSDISDKEFYGSWLLVNVVDDNGNAAYSADSLYQKAFILALEIWHKKLDIKDILTSLKKSELPKLRPSPSFQGDTEEWEKEFLEAWEQLIKVALRVAFVQSCKEQYRKLARKIKEAKSLDELKHLNISDAFPEYPL